MENKDIKEFLKSSNKTVQSLFKTVDSALKNLPTVEVEKIEVVINGEKVIAQRFKDGSVKLNFSEKSGKKYFDSLKKK